ncbi:recombination-associated protein RdgC [Lysobacter yananisis]|uniref:Recombination-associated protein RdgC n=1 Tax=Lysobacter yananisis TaxID=1003114 RepID=A0ABY9PBW6_9GAMM|nr:recombination-associated protein RdgC [Lysobacter yananisis]WMT03342.1 recombination-associated protein RdgC [Lysobacter yananisis]
MFFRSITFFRFPAGLDLAGLDAALRSCWLKPVGHLELASSGFVSPLGRGYDDATVRCGDAVWLTVGGEEKVLPPAAIDKVLNERLEALYAQHGRRPGGRARAQLRETIVHELLPRAMVKPTRLDAYLDLRCGFLAVDSGSRRAAEELVSTLRGALGHFPALPLNAEVAPRSILTGWVAGEPLPAGWTLGEDCNLQDAADGGSAVKCYRIDLLSDEVAEHLRAGRQATRLALVQADRVAFDLDESLVVRKLRFLDGALDVLADAEQDGLRAEIDARFALMSGEVRGLFLTMQTALKLSAMEP